MMDINCDMGESFGRYKIGNDEALMPHITSANVACGYHAGDAKHIIQTIKCAVQHNVRIGAHPGFLDRQGFGRRYMNVAKDELKAQLIFQISTIQSLASLYGSQMSYIKPHGALYHAVAHKEREADVMMSALDEMNSNVPIMCLPNSIMHEKCKARQYPFIREGFADRNYNIDGSLVSRAQENAVITNAEAALQHVQRIVENKKVMAVEGLQFSLVVDSLCIHGDNPAALAIAQIIHRYLSTS